MASKARSRKHRRASKAILKHGRDAAPRHHKQSGRTGSGLKGRNGRASRMRLNFKEISVSATKKYKDENGKTKQVTRKFFQTLNPFNKLDDGTVKDEATIRAEIDAQRKAWLADTNNFSKY